MGSFRRERVGDMLLSFIAERARRIDDSRLLAVTFTSADVSPDLKVADFCWSVFDPTVPVGEIPEARVRAVSDALIAATPEFKRGIGAELGLRFVPQLRFHYDDTPVRGARIDELLKQAKNES